MTAQLALGVSPRHEHPLGWHYEDLRDFALRLTILGRPFVLKNSKEIVVRRNCKHCCKRCRGRGCKHCRPALVPNGKAKKYLAEATKQLKAQWSAVFREPLPLHVMVNAAIVTYRATRHRNDASNLYQAPEDALQDAGVLTDDFQIASHDRSRRLYDPRAPRVEITLTPGPGVSS